MDKLTKLLTNISKLNREDTLAKVYSDAFIEFAIDLNRIEQLYDLGIDSAGKELIPPYTAITKFIKERKGQIIDHVTLNDTGEFYNTFDIKVFANMDFEISADDAGKDLFNKYGKDIVGWTRENTDKIVRFIQDGFIKEITIQVNKGL